MKAKIRNNVPYWRDEARRSLRNVARLVLIEDLGFGASGDIIPGIMERAQAIMQKYDTLYPDPRDETEAIARRLRAENIDHTTTKGSGRKADLSREHDIFFCAMMLSLRKEKDRFGKIRMKRFFDCMNRKIAYYNNTFAGTGGAGFEVMRERLQQYGSAFD